MAALIQFVDSIDASPTVRLDVNDALSWFCTSFKAPPPRLRRSVSANAMRDGDHVSSSSYENRTLELELTLIEEADEEYAAEEMQKLWCELDRAENFLLYHPEWLDKPVFFRLFRSDVNDLEELWTVPIARRITVELLAEPFALGLKESLGPYTVNNDPAAASNPLNFTASTVLGDVPTPAVLTLYDSVLSLGSLMVAQRTDAMATNLFFMQAESMTLGTDTTNPGGGPDATFSGTGTNNYRVTSFATATMTTRLSTSSLTVRRGKFRMVACVKRTDNTSVMSVRATVDSTVGQSVAVPLSSTRLLVDLGVFDMRGDWTYYDGFGYSASTTDPLTSTPAISLAASRTSGAGSLWWDYIVLIPAEVSMATVVASDLYAVLDGVGDTFAQYGTGGLAAKPVAVAGASPSLKPGATNRFTLVRGFDPTYFTTKGMVTTATLYYWPRYLHVRPSAS